MSQEDGGEAGPACPRREGARFLGGLQSVKTRLQAAGLSRRGLWGYSLVALNNQHFVFYQDQGFIHSVNHKTGHRPPKTQARADGAGGKPAAAAASPGSPLLCHQLTGDAQDQAPVSCTPPDAEAPTHCLEVCSVLIPATETNIEVIA